MPNMPFNPQMMQQFRSNPVQFLMQHRLNVPQNIANDPKAMVQHLMNTGQMSQSTFNRLDAFRKQFEQGNLK